jgi:hypothetical protein
MWAVLLGVVLVLVAAASSHAAQTLTPVHRPASPAAPLISAAQVRPTAPPSKSSRSHR